MPTTLPPNGAWAAKSDRIEDTLNYKSVAKRVLAFVEASEYQLVETLAEEVARLILKEVSVEWVKVNLNKPGAVRGSRDVGVAIERSRSTSPAGTPSRASALGLLAAMCMAMSLPNSWSAFANSTITPILLPCK